MLKNILGYIHGEVRMLSTGIEICENDIKSIYTDKISQQQENCENVMTLTWYRHFLRNGGLNQILKRQSSRFHYGSKVPAITISVFITILEQNR